MFTGISECMGIVEDISPNQGGFDISISSPISHELKVDQSLSHNGICLTVVAIEGQIHKVQAIAETVSKTELSSWKTGSMVNLERCMPANGRFDGHIVQGHVDTIAAVVKVRDHDGQLVIWFEHDPEAGDTVQKGSVCVNGISLTVVESTPNGFSVAIIPYTREHTNLGKLTAGDVVNIEFDIIGKYLKKFISA